MNAEQQKDFSMLLSSLADSFRREERKGGTEAATTLSKAKVSTFSVA